MIRGALFLCAPPGHVDGREGETRIASDFERMVQDQFHDQARGFISYCHRKNRHQGAGAPLLDRSELAAGVILSGGFLNLVAKIGPSRIAAVDFPCRIDEVRI